MRWVCLCVRVCVCVCVRAFCIVATKSSVSFLWCEVVQKVAQKVAPSLSASLFLPILPDLGYRVTRSNPRQSNVAGGVYEGAAAAE